MVRARSSAPCFDFLRDPDEASVPASYGADPRENDEGDGDDRVVGPADGSSPAIRLILGDCRVVMDEMESESVAAIVTDPPYDLTAKGGKGGFMGHAWDASGVAFDAATWRSALRVLKPGGHLLAFGGSRTYHRMVCAVEDAGFEVRDCLMWVFASGFPKSLDVSRAIDKAAGAEREVVGQGTGRTGSRAQPNGSSFSDDNYQWPGTFDVTAPATEDAKRWEGWGTALKPAYEPILLARKPFRGTVADNVLRHGTGALNIDDCRVATSDKLGGRDQSPTVKIMPEGWHRPWMQDDAAKAAHAAKIGANVAKAESLGRWPANLIHDGSEEVLALFPQLGRSNGVKPGNKKHSGNAYAQDSYTESMVGKGHPGFGDCGSAARFFYCCKASKSDRGEGNTHATVKPNRLMRYLCRLVTPPGGVILDPFCGSGSTLKAAREEGFASIGIDSDPGHLAMASGRLGVAIG